MAKSKEFWFKRFLRRVGRVYATPKKEKKKISPRKILPEVKF